MWDETTFAGAVLAQTTEAIAIVDARTVVIATNSACDELFAAPRGALVGTTIADRVHPDDLQRAITVVVGVDGGARPAPGLLRFVRLDGSTATLEASVGTVVDPADGTSYLMVLLRDSALQNAHWSFLAALAANAPFADAADIFANGLSEGVDGPMAINFATEADADSVDDRGQDQPSVTLTRRTVVGSLPALLGAATEDGELDLTPGTPWTEAVHHDDAAWCTVDELPEPFRSAARERGLGACVAVPVADPGHELPALMVQWPQSVAMGPVLREAMLRRPWQTLTLALERRHAMFRLERMAHHDGLTGLVNREHFFAVVTGWLDEHQPTAIFYVDLDDFKPINDTYGHLVGDRVIAACAHRLRRLARPADVVARLGGDEFALAGRGVSADDAERIASRIVDALSSPIALATGTVQLGASVGCTVARLGQTVDAVVGVADAALYEAKRSGRNRWVRH